MVVVRGIPFVGQGMTGDFAYMMKDPTYHNTIFIFNDNVIDGASHNPHNGGGSASIRTESWKYADPSEQPRALGIPTGWSVSSGGFKTANNDLEPFAARAITLAVERIVLACTSHKVDQIIYSCDKSDPAKRKLGSGIFTLQPPLLRYIEDKLHNIPSRVSEGSKFTLARVAELEEQVTHVARLHERLAQSGASCKRSLDDDEPKRRLLVTPYKLTPHEESFRGVRRIGSMQDGGQVYETVPMLKRSRLENNHFYSSWLH